jgi:hypothetical protein
MCPGCVRQLTFTSLITRRCNNGKEESKEEGEEENSKKEEIAINNFQIVIKPSVFVH